MECTSPISANIQDQTLPPEQSSRKRTAEESGIFQTFEKAIGDGSTNQAPKKIRTISHHSGGRAARKLIQSLSTQQDEFTYAIKVNEAFTSLLDGLSRLEGEKSQKIVDDFFDTLVSSVLHPLAFCDTAHLLSYESSVKRIKQSLRLCSAKLQLIRSPISINRFLMEIENKIIEIRNKTKFSSFPSFPQTEADALLAHLLPSANASQMKRAFLSLALNVVRKRLEKLTTIERGECAGELIDIISFTHEAEDHEFAPTPSLEDRLSELEKNASTNNPQILQSLRNKITSFMNGEIEVPINSCVTELADYVAEQKRVLEEELCHIEEGTAEKQPIVGEETLLLDLSPIRTGFASDVDIINQIILRTESARPKIGDLIEVRQLWKQQLVLQANIYKIKMTNVHGKVQVLLSKSIGSNNSAEFAKVAFLAGPHLCPNQPPAKIFAYKKIQELSDLRKRIAAYEEDLFLARSSQQPEATIPQLEDWLSSSKEKYKRALKDLAKEVKISREVPDAARMWIVRKLKDSTQPKGLLMEYIDEIPLYSIRHMAPPKGSKQQSKINTEVALLLCQAVERMHTAGYVHLALSSHHFLIEKKRDSFAVKLINFKMSVPEGGLGSIRGGDFLRPPELDDFKPDELFIAHAAIDNWALGFILIKIFYGYTLAEEFGDILYKFLHPDESNPRYYRKTQGWIYSQFKPELTPWENTKILVHQLLGKYPVIADVILHLIHPDPESRWTAERAAGRFHKIHTKLSS